MICNVSLCAFKRYIAFVLFILVYLMYENIRTSEVYVETSRILGLIVRGQVRFSQISPPLDA